MTARQPFHLLAKTVGSRCNLDCRYCYYLDRARPQTGTPGARMAPTVLEAYVREYIAAQPGPVVSFAWQGGEPTVAGLEFFRTALRLQRRYAGGRAIENTLQTNGTLLDDAWCEFLGAERFLVGLSIDGPAPLHDACRVDRRGRPTFERVMRGVELLHKHRVSFNTLTAVHRGNATRPLEVYRFLRSAGSGFLQFIPIVEREASPAGAPGRRLAAPPQAGTGDGDTSLTPWSLQPEDWGDFLCGVFDEWVQHDVGRVFVQQFDAALASWVGAHVGVCAFAEHCGGALAVEHNGDVYSCDHYVYPPYRLGNLVDSPLAAMVDSPQQQAFGRAKSAGLPEHCRACPVHFACRGECPKHRFARTSNGEPGLNHLCAGYRRFFTHVEPAMRTMAGLLRAGQPPAAIMQLPGRRQACAGARGG